MKIQILGYYRDIDIQGPKFEIRNFKMFEIEFSLNGNPPSTASLFNE